MKTFCLLLAMLCLGSYSLAQKHIADSLVLLAEKAPGTEKATHYNDAAREFIKHDPRKGIEYAAKALEIATRENDFAEIYNALYSTADAYLVMGLYDSARITNLNTIEKYGSKLGNEHLAQLHNHLGSAYTNLQNNEKAIEHLLLSSEILDRLEPHQVTKTTQTLYIINQLNIGRILNQIKNYPKARKHLEHALEKSRAIGDSSRMMVAYNGLGIISEIEKDYEQSVILYAEAARLAEKLGYKGNTARVSGNIGLLYYYMEDFESSLAYSFRALEIGKEVNDMFCISLASANIGRAYLKMEQPDSALEYILLSQHVAREQNYPVLLGNSHEFLSHYYAMKGDYKSAFYEKTEYASLKDTIYEQRLAAQITETQTRYETEKKQQAIELLTRDAEIKDLVIKRRNTQAYALTGLIALLSVSGFLFFGRQREKQRREKIEMQKRNLETMQQLLRAQINPHFIFNALNSVQSYISANDELKAMSYLAKFSKLMRNILENSMKKMITIEEELETLQLYMELESMRFRDAFEFEFGIHEKIDPSRTYIPPMLIQPFVENSIKHGFLNLEGKGRIVVDFFRINGVVSCKIEDNGVGRPQMLAEDKLAAQHRSLGMQLTRDRLHAMQQDWNVAAKFDVENLTSPDGKACGTRVLIDMPYEVD